MQSFPSRWRLRSPSARRRTPAPRAPHEPDRPLSRLPIREALRRSSTSVPLPTGRTTTPGVHPPICSQISKGECLGSLQEIGFVDVICTVGTSTGYVVERGRRHILLRSGYSMHPRTIRLGSTKLALHLRGYLGRASIRRRPQASGTGNETFNAPCALDGQFAYLKVQ